MKIKFLDTDPRAGTVAQMDSHRGQELIDQGSAEAYSEQKSAAPDGVVLVSGADLKPKPVKKASARAATKRDDAGDAKSVKAFLDLTGAA